MKKIYCFHPLLFAIYPILSLWSVNIEYIPFSDVMTSLIVSVALTVFLVLILWLALKDLRKSSLLVSGILFLFFTYGYVSNLVKDKNIWDNQFVPVRFLIPIWIVLFFIWVWNIFKRDWDKNQLNSLLFWIGIALIGFSAARILNHYRNPLQIEKMTKEDIEQIQKEFRWESENELPDIYYIVIDGYGRKDILLDLYGYDNSGFINQLYDLGFYVVDRSVSNYNQTALSLSSSMNMEYINYYSDTLGRTSENRKPLIEMIRQSHVRKILEINGYQLVNIKSGYIYTDIEDADIYLDGETNSNQVVKDDRSANTFEWLLLESTAFQGLFDILIIAMNLESQDRIFADTGFQEHRERIINAFELLDDVADRQGSYFVFVHIVAPHPPFVFDSLGNEVQNVGVYTVADGNHYHGGRGDYRENYKEGYIGQVEFVSTQILDAIDRILTKSDVLPIIILQADHGPGAYLFWDSFENSNVVERLSILNAIFFPNRNYEMLYPTITPVNTFRVIFKTFFGINFEILNDRSYFSLWELPFDFIDVTDIVLR
jgi:hypothetical protein